MSEELTNEEKISRAYHLLDRASDHDRGSDIREDLEAEARHLLKEAGAEDEAG